MRQFCLRALLTALVLAAAVAVGCDDSPGPSPLPCNYTVSTPGTFAAAGGTATITVNTLGHCEWTATSSVSWVSISSGASGTGAGSVAVTVAANTSTEARTGTLTVGGQTVTISQSGAAPQECTYVVSPLTRRFGSQGGTGTVTVAAPAGCNWTAVSNTAWLSITAGASGVGNGTVTYAVGVYTGTGDRDGTLTIAGQTVAIAQDGPAQVACEYSVDAVEITFVWYGPGGSVGLTSNHASCAWTVRSTEEWLKVTSPTAGSGSTRIQFTVEAFIRSTTREGLLQIRWPTPTEGQNVRVVQTGCWYALSATDVTIPVNGGTRTVSVITFGGANTMVGCPWSAVSQDNWIHVVSSMPRSGEDNFTFTVDPNPTGEIRTGYIKVAELTLIVRQSAQ